MREHFEEYPLQYNSQWKRRPRTNKGPLRVIRLCLFGVFLPTLLVAVPLYLRYHVYSNQLYPFAMSDMRLLDRRVSTIWCQRQLVSVKENATFNAFLLPDQPHVARSQQKVSMVRQLLLEDDMKEYWGFYLLAGSSVTISTCVRWPGASLIVIRGHKHLHECAYIGDDSSEELDEIIQALKDGTYVNTSDVSASDSLPNAPQFMKRHRPDVLFHHPIHINDSNNHSLHTEGSDADEITDKELLENLLSTLSKKTDKMNKQREKLLQKFKKQTRPNETSSEELFKEVVQKLDKLGDRKHKVLKRLNNKWAKKYDGFENRTSRRKRRDIVISPAAVNDLNIDDEKGNLAIEEGFTADGIADHRGRINETTLNDRSNSEFWSSFSSSEEALLNCEGLILNLPLSPHPKCEENSNEKHLNEASLTNTVTYLVPSNGYYFFVFNSENEVQVNYIRVRFELNKTMYDVSHPVSSCANSTSQCSLDLKFFSNERMVMEVPVTKNESLWNEELIVISECQPRTMLYAFFVLSVPVLILVFAFH